MNILVPKAFRLNYLFLVLIGLVTNNVWAQTVSLNSQIDSVRVGELFSLNIKVQRGQEIDRLVLPDSTMLPPSLEWVGIQQFKITDFADSLRISVQFFGNQDLLVPGFPIGFVIESDTSFAFTNNLIIPFASSLPSADAELKPIKPNFEFNRFPWVWLLLISALLAAGIWAYFTFRKKDEQPALISVQNPVPFNDPLEELLRSINALKNDYNLAQTNNFKYFYSEISDSIRTYYENLYNIPALESTTRELLRYLDAFGLDIDMIKTTRSVLNKSDMVKFAKFTPTLDSAWKCYDEAIAFIERARLIDASRIARKKAEYEATFMPTEPEQSQSVSEPDQLKEDA
jgi:hypothetical protein